MIAQLQDFLLGQLQLTADPIIVGLAVIAIIGDKIHDLIEARSRRTRLSRILQTLEISL